MSVTSAMKRCHYTLEMKICVCVCVCASCQMGVYDSTAGASLPGDISFPKHTHKPHKGLLRPQQCYSPNQPRHLHYISSSSSSRRSSRSSRRRRRRTAQLHYLYPSLKHYVREMTTSRPPDDFSLSVLTLSHSRSSLGGSFLLQKSKPASTVQTVAVIGVNPRRYFFLEIMSVVSNISARTSAA